MLHSEQFPNEFLNLFSFFSAQFAIKDSFQYLQVEKGSTFFTGGTIFHSRPD
jgi:hypothetical protein